MSDILYEVGEHVGYHGHDLVIKYVHDKDRSDGESHRLVSLYSKHDDGTIASPSDVRVSKTMVCPIKVFDDYFVSQEDLTFLIDNIEDI
ncbi:MAG: hypothetical protein ACOC5T_02715 [Elusimicrobiota bacterium]